MSDSSNMPIVSSSRYMIIVSIEYTHAATHRHRGVGLCAAKPQPSRMGPSRRALRTFAFAAREERAAEERSGEGGHRTQQRTPQREVQALARERIRPLGICGKRIWEGQG